MPAVGGFLVECTYNHPTIGDGSFYFMSDEDGNFDLGGLRKNDDPNKIDGSGARIYEMTNTGWQVEGTISHDTNTDKTMERVITLAESPIEADLTFSHSNGSVYAGKGTIVGDVKGSIKATMPLKFSGSGKLKKIA